MQVNYVEYSIIWAFNLKIKKCSKLSRITISFSCKYTEAWSLKTPMIQYIYTRLNERLLKIIVFVGNISAIRCILIDFCHAKVLFIYFDMLKSTSLLENYSSIQKFGFDRNQWERQEIAEKLPLKFMIFNYLFI